MAPAARCSPGTAVSVDDEELRDLSVNHGLSTYRIALRVGTSRGRVTRQLRAAGVVLAAGGRGRRRDHRRLAEPVGFRALLKKLYVDQRQTSKQIGDRLGMSERTVRNRLAEYGIGTRSRGRCHREDREPLPEADLIALYALYALAGLSAEQVGDTLGVSRYVVLREAHELGVPVRLGGPPPRNGPSEIELIAALYADPIVADALRRHQMRQVPPGGPLWQRFPTPVPLTRELVTDLYVECGLSINHLEILTGQPASTVRRRLHTLGVPSRRAGGATPFRRRWRASMSRAPSRDESDRIGKDLV